MYKFETHLHTKETSRCGKVSAEDQVRKYKELGYDGICVTDHLYKAFADKEEFHNVWKLCIDGFLAGYHEAKRAGDACGLKVILGAELRFPDSERDYLVYGINEEWLYNHPFITDMSPQEFFSKYGNEVLIIHAHPYRDNDDVLYNCVHGIEMVNGNPRHDSRNYLALELAKKHPELIRTCGSDAHRIGDEGSAALCFDKLVTDSFEYKEALEKGEYKMYSELYKDIIAEGEKTEMFDYMIIGQVCLDINTDYDGTAQHMNGGAVLYSGHAAAALGCKVAIVTKEDPSEIDVEAAFSDCEGVTIFNRPSKHNTHMENVYFTATRETRDSRCTSNIDPYTAEDIPEERARIYHMAGLVAGDISGDVIKKCAKRGDLAIDVQCMMRRVEPDQHLKLYDWEEKKEYLPLVKYLKTDAAEAEALTGTDDREEAAKILYSWGAKEIMITHNTEVIVYDGETIYRAPLKPRNLSGRTGRGDTTFATYLTERLTKGIQESLDFAAATVSMKMETPGPLLCKRKDIVEYINSVYHRV